MGRCAPCYRRVLWPVEALRQRPNAPATGAGAAAPESHAFNTNEKLERFAVRPALSRPLAGVLTEMYLRTACSCQATLRRPLAPHTQLTIAPLNWQSLNWHGRGQMVDRFPDEETMAMLAAVTSLPLEGVQEFFR
jgi:hypothetical protein